MKKFIALILFFSVHLLANNSSLVLKSYETNEAIEMSCIAEYAFKFKVENQDEKDVNFEIVLIDSEEPSTLKQNNLHKFNWIMLELDANLSTGNYWLVYGAFEFTEHTFLANQLVDKFSLLGRKILSFHYDEKQNSKRYFFKVKPSQSHVIPRASLYTAETFSTFADENRLKLLISFFLIGLIFMTAIYNGALYLYNREKSFLYYMFMQLFMVVVLVYQTEIIETYVMGTVESEEVAIFFYFIVVEIVVLFILFFVRSFLETKKYLPFHDKILHYITIFAIVDLVFFFFPTMLIFNLYTFIFLYVLWVAWLRFRAGYKPALFFLLGWFALMLGVFFSDFFPDEVFMIDPIFLGSAVEALFFSMAISSKMQEIKNEKEEQRELLVHQSRLASMGDMLGNIAHQWRQPLTRLGFILMNIEEKDKEKLHEKKLEEAENQLEFMSQTIDDFRNFYASNKEKELFSLAEESQKIVDLLAFKEIELKVDIVKDVEILNYKNEYKQVLLNLLTNAKDVLLERKISSPKISIEIDGALVKVRDNAGGIKGENIQKIFEPYFSTKEQGLGIGLYMSKMIVEKNMGARIKVFNGDEGAIFSLDFGFSVTF